MFKIRDRVVVYHVETGLTVREFDRPDHAKHFIKLAKQHNIDHFGAEIHRDSAQFDPAKLAAVGNVLTLALETLPKPIRYLVRNERTGTTYTAELEKLDDAYGLLQLIDYNRRADLHKRSTLLHISSGYCIGVGTKPEIKQLHKLFVADRWQYVAGNEFASGVGNNTMRSFLKAINEAEYYA